MEPKWDELLDGRQQVQFVSSGIVVPPLQRAQITHVEITVTKTRFK
jgi:hypothetical protein